MINSYYALAQRIRQECDELERVVAAILRHWHTSKTATDQDAYLNSVALEISTRRILCLTSWKNSSLRYPRSGHKPKVNSTRSRSISTDSHTRTKTRDVIESVSIGGLLHRLFFSPQSISQSTAPSSRARAFPTQARFRHMPSRDDAPSHC